MLSCFLDPLLELRIGGRGGALQFIPFLLQFGEIRLCLALMPEIEGNCAVDLL
jgi:hypothetical protein